MSGFPATRWSLVLACSKPDEPRARAALEELCRACWQPLFRFARRTGAGDDLAQDQVQGFLADFLGRKGFGAATPERGRLRTFLLASFRHWLANARDLERAQKRGGGREPIPLDAGTEDSSRAAEPADLRTPEQEFERRWALDLVDRAVALVRAEYAGARSALCEQLLPTLTGEPPGRPLAEVGAQLGMSEGAVKVAALRLRRRFGELLRQEVRDTLANGQDLADELALLRAALLPPKACNPERASLQEREEDHDP